MERETIFTIPSDFKVDSLKRVLELNKKFSIKTNEVYGSMKSSKIGSGRKFFELPDVSIEQLKSYVKFCNENGLKFNYTLNLSCFDNKEFTECGKSEIIRELKMLVDLGITDFTVALPSLIEILEKEFPEVNVTLSIICGVDSISKMKHFCSYKNVKNIYIHERLYRQIEKMKILTDIAHKYNKKVGVIVNSFCLSDCPFRAYHYNFGAHATMGCSYIIPEYYGSKCALMKIMDKRNVLNAPWIRPDDIQKYIDIGIDRFKVSGREMHSNNADIFKVLEVYNSRKFTGNLAELFMCFTKCAYSEIFNIKNDEKLNKYIESVFDGKVACNRFGCDDCMKCKDALEAISINPDGQNKWKNVFEKRIATYRGDENI